LSPTGVHELQHPLALLAAAHPRVLVQGSRMIASTVIRRVERAWGSWNTICIFGRIGRSRLSGRVAISCPSTRIDPEVTS
jgi:hypothetical protein